MPSARQEIETLLRFNDDFARELQVRNFLTKEKQASRGKTCAKAGRSNRAKPDRNGGVREIRGYQNLTTSSLLAQDPGLVRRLSSIELNRGGTSAAFQWRAASCN